MDSGSDLLPEPIPTDAASPHSGLTSLAVRFSLFFIGRLNTFTFMTKRTVGALFCCLAVVMYLARYVFALWYGGGGASTQSPDLFA